MTGWLNTTNPLSRITIGGLQDCGYAVNYNTAESYAPPSNCRCKRRLRQRDPQSGVPPKPSPEARKNARMYGEKVLKERKKDKQNMPKVDGVEFVGDMFLSVIYRCRDDCKKGDEVCKNMICFEEVTGDD
jgi:hypothetical protein